MHSAEILFSELWAQMSPSLPEGLQNRFFEVLLDLFGRILYTENSKAVRIVLRGAQIRVLFSSQRNPNPVV